MGRAVIAFLLGVTGCSATPFTTAAPDASTDAPSDATADAARDGDGAAAEAAVEGGGMCDGGDCSCGASANKVLCRQCCKTFHQPGAIVLHSLEVACSCTGPICNVECDKSLCADAGLLPTGACEACVLLAFQGGGCAADLTQCQSDMGCVNVINCFIAECAQLP